MYGKNCPLTKLFRRDETYLLSIVGAVFIDDFLQFLLNMSVKVWFADDGALALSILLMLISIASSIPSIIP
jgi:hypothetical protein